MHFDKACARLGCLYDIFDWQVKEVLASRLCCDVCNYRAETPEVTSITAYRHVVFRPELDLGRSNFLNPIQSNPSTLWPNPQWWPKCWPKSNPIHMTDRRHTHKIIRMALFYLYSQSTNASLLQYYTYYITRKCHWPNEITSSALSSSS